MTKKTLKFRGMDQEGVVASFVSENGEEFQVSYDFLESVVHLMGAQACYRRVSKRVEMAQLEAEIVPFSSSEEEE